MMADDERDEKDDAVSPDAVEDGLGETWDDEDDEGDKMHGDEKEADGL